MKLRKILSFPLLTLLSLPVVFADTMDTIGEAFNFIFEIGGFVWVTDKVSVTKFALFLIIFAVVHFVLNKGKKKKKDEGGNRKPALAIFGGDQGNKVSAIIAFSAAAISVIFIPDPFALEIGKTYSAVFALLIVGLPLGILIYFAIALGNANFSENHIWAKHLIRLFCALAGIALVSGVANEYTAVTSLILPLIPASTSTKKEVKKG